MRPKAYFKALAPLLGKPYFTAKEARVVGVSPATLSHYVKTGELKRVGRGVYTTKSQEFTSLRWEDLVLAVHSTPHGVVCRVSALAIYNLTEEIPRQHWIGIRHGTSAKKHRGVKIVRFRNLGLGKTEISLDGAVIPIFDRERTIIDAFRLLSREIAIKALKTAIAHGGKNRLDLKKIEAYAKELRFCIAPYLLSVTT